jgi:hypothetical protein
MILKSKTSYHTWCNRYENQINDLYKIFLGNIEDKFDNQYFYTNKFFNEFKYLLYKKSSGFLSNFI